MEGDSTDHISEFHTRFHAARLIAKPDEPIRFDGEDKTAAIGRRYILSVNLKDRELVLSCTPAECNDAELRDSLSALPGEPCRFAEITVFHCAARLMPVATVPLGDEPLGRVELQEVRSALDLVASRIKAAIEQSSRG